jgi:hypothetical protein
VPLLMETDVEGVIGAGRHGHMPEVANSASVGG